MQNKNGGMMPASSAIISLSISDLSEEEPESFNQTDLQNQLVNQNNSDEEEYQDDFIEDFEEEEQKGADAELIATDEDEEDFMEIELDEQDDNEETKFDQIMNMDPVELKKNTILGQSQASSSILTVSIPVEQESIKQKQGSNKVSMSLKYPLQTSSDPQQTPHNDSKEDSGVIQIDENNDYVQLEDADNHKNDSATYEHSYTIPTETIKVRNEDRESQEYSRKATTQQKTTLKSKQIKIRQPMLESNKSKESLSLQHQSAANRNFKKASFKSLKTSGANDSGKNYSRSRWDDTRSSKDKDYQSQGQDQYSSHKVLINSKNLYLDTNNPKQQPQLQVQQQKSGNGGNQDLGIMHNKRHLSKNKRLNGGNLGVSKLTEAEASIQQQSNAVNIEQFSSSKQGTNTVASSLNQLFSGSTKRGSSNNQQAPMSQKHTKSKARIIRNILQSSNYKSEKKKKDEASTNQQTFDDENDNTTQQQQMKFELLCENTNSKKEHQKVEAAFDEMFAEVLEDAVKSPSTAASSSLDKAELNLKRVQIRQRYQTARQNLQSFHQKFKQQQKVQIECLRRKNECLNRAMFEIEYCAQVKIDYLNTREHTRIWRNVGRLTLSWITSLLLEAEKSRQFALLKTKRSLEQIIFTTQEFSAPKSISKKQLISGIKETSAQQNNNTRIVQHITRDLFCDFQTQEVYKFLSRLPAGLQFLVNFRSLPFHVSKQLSMVAGSTDSSISSEAFGSSKRLQVSQTILDFAKAEFEQRSLTSQIQLPKRKQETSSAFEAIPLVVISSFKNKDQPLDQDLRQESTQFVVKEILNQLPSPSQALSGCYDILKEHQDGFSQAIASINHRKNDSIVSNQLLDVLEANAKSRSLNRLVYVCLKEAQSYDIELPKHTEMLSRMHQNKTIGRLYENATPIALCFKKMIKGGQSKNLNETWKVQSTVIKPIKGLSQLKVEFKESPKIFGILAEVDFSILKQTKEFTEFILPKTQQSSTTLLHSSASSQGVSLYVIEKFTIQPESEANQKLAVRQLQPFEVLFLLQQHLRLSKPVKMINFVVNSNELIQWKSQSGQTGNSASQAAAFGADNQAINSAKTKVKSIVDNRNSITIGSIHHEEFRDEDKDIDTSRMKKDGHNQNSLDFTDPGIANKNKLTKYVIIDEQGQESQRLLRRYIVRTIKTSPSQTDTAAMLEQKDELTKFEIKQQSQNKQAMLCVWPNCLEMTDPNKMFCLQTQILQAHSSAAPATAQTTPNQNQLQTSVTGINRKSRPDSAYRHKQNNSQSNPVGGGGANSSQDKLQTKRINKLRIALELDLADNLYQKFIKKGKVLKPTHHQNNSSTNKTRTSMNMAYNSAMAQSRYMPTDASSMAPVLGPNHTYNSQAMALSPLFAKLCPYHQRLERFLAYRLNISLVPNGPINPNAFLRGLRVYGSWRSEVKNSLLNDLFTTKQQTNHTQSLTIIGDTLQRIYAFAHTQVGQMSGPDIVSLIQTLQQIPKSINYPDKFFVWIEQFTREMSPLMVKNIQFKDAVAHFQFQLAPLSANLKQVKLNEDFIVVELTKWYNDSQVQLKQQATSQNTSYLTNNFNSLSKILQVSDVIHRFTFFQQFINKMNTFGETQPSVQNTSQKTQSQPNRTQQQSQHGNYKTNPAAIQTQNSMSNHVAASLQQQFPHSVVQNQKANLQPYITSQNFKQNLVQGGGGPVKVIPSDGILFQSQNAQMSQQQQYKSRQKAPGATVQQSQAVAPLNYNIKQTQGFSHQKAQMPTNSQSQRPALPNFISNTHSGGSVNLENVSQYQVATTTPHQNNPSQLTAQKGNASPIQIPANSHNNQSVHHQTMIQQQQATSTLDKITAIYGMQHRRTIKEQPSQQLLGSTPGPTTPTNNQLQMLASDGFLAQKKFSIQFDNFNMPSQNTSVHHQQVTEHNSKFNSKVQSKQTSHTKPRDVTSADYRERFATQNKPQNLFQDIQSSAYGQKSELFNAYNIGQPLTSLNQLPLNTNQGGLMQSSFINNTARQAQADNAFYYLSQKAPLSSHNQQTSSSSKQQHMQNSLMQRSNRANQNQMVKQTNKGAPSGQKIIQQQKANSSEQVVILAQSPKKRNRILSKNAIVSASVNSHQDVNQDHQATATLGFNFQPAPQTNKSRDLTTEESRMPLYNASDIRYASTQIGAATANNYIAVGGVGSSFPLTSMLTDISKQPNSNTNPMSQSSTFMQRQAYQTQTNSFIKTEHSGTTPMTLIASSHQHQVTQNTPSQSQNSKTVLLRNNNQKQRAASAKKEMKVTYSSGIVGQQKTNTVPPNMAVAKQHWSMQPSSFGAALAQDQQLQNNNLVSSSKEHIPARFALASTNNISKANNNNMVNRKQSSEPLVPLRYHSNNQAARSSKDQDLLNKNVIATAASAMSNLDIQPSTQSKNMGRGSKGRPRKDSNSIAATYATEKQQHIVAARYGSSVGFTQQNQLDQLQPAQQNDISLTAAKTKNQNPRQEKKKNPSRMPPQMIDTRVNYQSGIRIINSVLTPNNVPRSAVTAKTYGPQDVSDPTAIAQPFAAPIRNITSAGQPHSSKQAANIIQIQRTTMINNNSTGFQAIDAQMSGGANSKVVTQQLLNMQKSNQADKAAHLQVTYANAMPRLASANAYLTKQSRKLRPSNISSANNNGGSKGLQAQALPSANSSSNNRNIISMPMQQAMSNAGLKDPAVQNLHSQYPHIPYVKNNSLFPTKSNTGSVSSSTVKNKATNEKK